jgi:hypothetical protein
MPAVYRQCALIYSDFWNSDFWNADGVVLPSKRHRAVGKETGKTSYIVRASAVKQNGSTAPSDNGCPDWRERPYPSRRNWITTLVRFGILFITTMRRCLLTRPFRLRTTLR